MKEKSDFLFKGTKYGPLMHLLVPMLIGFSMLTIYLVCMDSAVKNLWPIVLDTQFHYQPDRILCDMLGVGFISFLFSLALANYINGKATRPTITWPWVIPAVIVFLYSFFVMTIGYGIGDADVPRFFNFLGIICIIVSCFLTITITKPIGLVYILGMLLLAIFIVGFLPALLVILPLALVQGGVEVLLKWAALKTWGS